jgi:hypothetical protein
MESAASLPSLTKPTQTENIPTMAKIITFDEFRTMIDAGRVAYSDSGTFGQTGAGCHTYSTEERSCTVDDVLWYPAPGLVRAFYYDPERGMVWNGATRAYRVLPEIGAPLEPAQRDMDPANLAYQRSLLRQ